MLKINRILEDTLRELLEMVDDAQARGESAPILIRHTDGDKEAHYEALVSKGILAHVVPIMVNDPSGYTLTADGLTYFEQTEELPMNQNINNNTIALNNVLSVNMGLNLTTLALRNISEDILPSDDRNTLIYLLGELAEIKERGAAGEKTRKILEFLVDKATDVLITTIPYVGQCLMSL